MPLSLRNVTFKMNVPTFCPFLSPPNTCCRFTYHVSALSLDHFLISIKVLCEGPTKRRHVVLGVHFVSYCLSRFLLHFFTGLCFQIRLRTLQSSSCLFAAAHMLYRRMIGRLSEETGGGRPFGMYHGRTSPDLPRKHNKRASMALFSVTLPPDRLRRWGKNAAHSMKMTPSTWSWSEPGPL